MYPYGYIGSEEDKDEEATSFLQSVKLKFVTFTSTVDVFPIPSRYGSHGRILGLENLLRPFLLRKFSKNKNKKTKEFGGDRKQERNVDDVEEEEDADENEEHWNGEEKKRKDNMKDDIEEDHGSEDWNEDSEDSYGEEEEEECVGLYDDDKKESDEDDVVEWIRD